MSAQNEEDDRLAAEIAADGWCRTCEMPIGYGHCGGCNSVAACMGDWPSAGGQYGDECERQE